MALARHSRRRKLHLISTIIRAIFRRGNTLSSCTIKRTALAAASTTATAASIASAAATAFGLAVTGEGIGLGVGLGAHRSRCLRITDRRGINGGCGGRRCCPAGVAFALTLLLAQTLCLLVVALPITWRLAARLISAGLAATSVGPSFLTTRLTLVVAIFMTITATTATTAVVTVIAIITTALWTVVTAFRPG